MSESILSYTSPRVAYSAVLKNVPANVATDYWFELPTGVSPTNKVIFCSLSSPQSTKDYIARVFGAVQNGLIRINIKTDTAQTSYYVNVEIMTVVGYLNSTNPPT